MNVRPADLARRLGTTPQAVNRLTTLRHATKIDGLVDDSRLWASGLSSA
ncbi:MAG: hypothetical protein JNM79_12245 [Burkholderiales bacterium]|nr:hypothetical protein [Burkholderiales bacterium]